MTGLIHRNNETYIFRDDHAHGDEVWAWNVKDSYDRSKLHRWSKMPKGAVEVFDIDNPPATVSYQPLLN